MTELKSIVPQLFLPQTFLNAFHRFAILVKIILRKVLVRFNSCKHYYIYFLGHSSSGVLYEVVSVPGTYPLDFQ